MRALIRILLLVFLAAACFLFACSDEGDDCDECSAPEDDDDSSDDDNDDASGERPPSVYSPTMVVPSAGLPPEVALQQANNNLDVVKHEGRVFLAFRTGPFHFASRRVEIYVVSSEDQENWDFEMTYAMGADLRETRLLSWDGRLFLYFSVLGINPLDFEPQGMMVSEYLGPGDWTEPEWFYEEGLIAWRTKTVDGVPYMLAYKGGEGIYDASPDPIRVHWLTTDDGYNWEPVIPGQPVVLEGGSSETDFVFMDDGSLVAVSRNEMGDESGWGMKICRAEAQTLGQWECVNDPRKFDSPLMFRHGPDAYLIGRRNLNGTGYYDLGYDDMSPTLQQLLYELIYWFYPKRCSLWRVDPETLDVSFVVDLPSRGDTCFPALIRTDETRYQVYNYTSPLDGPDVIWVKGQLGPTHVVRTTLEFPDS